jgi:hypothetical protein
MMDLERGVQRAGTVLRERKQAYRVDLCVQTKPKEFAFGQTYHDDETIVLDVREHQELEVHDCQEECITIVE